MKPINIAKIVKLLVICIVILFVAWIPAPFKPSIWAYLKTQTIKNQLITFTDPVFLPDGEFRSGSSFSTYEGWQNAYGIRYMSKPGERTFRSAYMVQFTGDSSLKNIDGEGLSNEQISDLKHFTTSEDNCEVFDKKYNINFCKTSKNGYLIRSINCKNQIYYIVTFVSDRNRSLSPKTTKHFQPVKESTQHQIIKSVTPLDIQSATKFIKIEI